MPVIRDLKGRVVSEDALTRVPSPPVASASSSLTRPSVREALEALRPPPPAAPVAEDVAALLARMRAHHAALVELCRDAGTVMDQLEARVQQDAERLARLDTVEGKLARIESALNPPS